DGIKGIKTSDENTLNYGLLVGFIGAFICLHISGLTEANFFDGEVLHLFLFLTAISLTALPAFRVSSK
ncbi:MAG: hypothetical protein KDD58_16175, partial [Bdellovibrionales bacterium]|nr:hypothetical protein [Bdellovibrionales bacterium]